MKYNSTRSKKTVVTASQAIAQGISEEQVPLCHHPRRSA